MLLFLRFTIHYLCIYCSSCSADLTSSLKKCSQSKYYKLSGPPYSSRSLCSRETIKQNANSVSWFIKNVTGRQNLSHNISYSVSLSYFWFKVKFGLSQKSVCIIHDESLNVYFLFSQNPLLLSPYRHNSSNTLVVLPLVPELIIQTL